MSITSGEVRATEEARSLVSALRELHSHAGKPSVRRLAQEIGTVSHTTVAEALSGRRIPSWPVVASIVQHLGGTEAMFRQLWAAATAESPCPTQQDRQDDLFLARYRDLVAEYYSTLWIADPDYRHQRHIDEVFVSPRLIDEYEKLSPGSPTLIDATQFEQRISHTVLLGGPGSGKSTLCQFLMQRHAAKAESALPFLVPVREFAADFPLARSIVAFIENRLEIIFQRRPPQGLIERQLKNRPTVLLFDGLDEVMGITRRAEVAAIVKLFTAEYPLVRVLVTSRPTDQLQDPLGSQFSTYRLLEFDETQIVQYIRQWFVTNDSITTTDAEAHAHAFLHDTTQLSDLRTNPLLLAILCTLFHSTVSIPRSRPQIYEQLAVLMLEGWDRSREITASTPIRVLLPPALRNLAFRMLRDNIQEVSASEIRDVIKTAIQDNVTDDEIATQSADLFDFVRSRAWVLTRDKARSSGGTEMYRFSHRSLMEYLAAQHFARIFQQQPENAARELTTCVSTPAWRQWAELAIQLIDQSLNNGAARIIEAVLDQADKLDASQRCMVINFLTETTGVTNLPAPLSLRLAEAAGSIAANAHVDRTGRERPLVRESLDLDIDQWEADTAVPPSVGGALGIVRDLLRESRSNVDLANVALTWIWATFEASLRGCLSSQDAYVGNPVNTALEQGLITANEALRLEQVYTLRSSIAHGQPRPDLTYNSTVQAVKSVHDVISAIYHRSIGSVHHWTVKHAPSSDTTTTTTPLISIDARITRRQE